MAGLVRKEWVILSRIRFGQMRSKDGKWKGVKHWAYSVDDRADPPSNVTRISRVLRRTCSDGSPQIITYFPGVGSGNIIDHFTGGIFGMGLDQVRHKLPSRMASLCHWSFFFSPWLFLCIFLSHRSIQDIREAYNFVCTNYVDGDAIVLVGFSRGAFTARSVADMISSIGLLTPAGMANFYAIFSDYEEIGSETRDPDSYLVHGLPAYSGQDGQSKQRWEEKRLTTYRRGLKAVRMPYSSFF